MSTEQLKERLAFLEPQVRMLDVKQKAVKVLANALYGISANAHFSGYDPDLGEAITLTGQVGIRTAMKLVDGFLNAALKTTGVTYCDYSDTDSMYITLDRLVEKTCQGKTNKEIVDFLEKFVFDVLQPMLNKGLSKMVESLGAPKCMLEFKLECIGTAIIYCAKKRYAFNILYSEGVRYESPKMKVMGMEIVRSSTPSAIKEQLKKGVKIALEKEEADLQAYVAEVHKSFMSLHYTEIAFPRGCNGLRTYSDASNIYKPGCPMHVRASLLYNHYLKKMGLESKYPLIGEGDKIRFIALKKPNPFHEDVIGFPVKIPDEFGLEKYIDYETQFQKAFMAPLNSVLESMKWSSEPQVNLEDFF
jgi:DNA polymerase elongation subunit (family B)